MCFFQFMEVKKVLPRVSLFGELFILLSFGEQEVLHFFLK